MSAAVQRLFESIFGPRSGEAFAWLRGATLDWLFVAKAIFALLLTGWLAMRFQLEQPGTAMLTVSIVIHPQSGMVLAKSFYRAFGTLIGCVAALLIVAAFPQHRVPFLLAMAAWIGLCAAGASLHRNFKSYGFVLSGYTAAIVALPVVNHPQAVFDSAVMRVSEVLLGIFIAGVVSDALFPQRLGVVLRESVRSQFAHFMVFVRESLGGVLPREDLAKVYLRFVREVVQLENQRSSVVFEDAGVRLRSPRLRRLNHAFMSASTSYQSLHHLLNRLDGAARAPVRERLMAIAARLSAVLAPIESAPFMAPQAQTLSLRLDDLQARLPALIARERAGLAGRADRLDFDSGAELLLRFCDELRDYAKSYVAMAAASAVRASDEPSLRFSHSNDWAAFAWVWLRTAAAMFALGLLWIATAWPEGASAMALGTAFVGLMATFPDPLGAIRTMLVGYVLGTVAGLFCAYGVLVRMDGFVLLAAGLVPFLMIGFYLAARPRWAGLGSGFLLALLTTAGIRNPMTYDALAAINSGIAQLVGVVVAGASFMVFTGTIDNTWLRRRMLKRLRTQLVDACLRPLPGLLPRFESANRDAAAQIVANTRAGSDESRHMLEWSLAAQETGRAVIELRLSLAADAPAQAAFGARIERSLQTLARFYATPTHDTYREARDCLALAMEATRANDALMAQLHLIRLALLDKDSALAEFVEAPLEEAPHAP